MRWLDIVFDEASGKIESPPKNSAGKTQGPAITASALVERQKIVRFLREEAARITWVETQDLIDDGVDPEEIDMVITLIDGLADEIEEEKHLEDNRYE